jgi:hypothetical protein
MEKMRQRGTFILAGTLLCCSFIARAQVTYTNTTSDDAFLATGSPTNPTGTDLTAENFGAAGVLYIAPASSPNGEYQSVLRFDLSGVTNLFDATYGPHWIISAVSLMLTANFGTAGSQPDNLMFNPINGGNFVIEWIGNDNWVEGTGRPKAPTMDGVTYGSIPALLTNGTAILCTNTFSPPGDNIPVTWPLPINPNMVNDIMQGGPVSFRLFAADNQVSYLFNSHNYGNGNQPLILVTAVPLLKILSGYFTNGYFRLIGIGGANRQYQVQASSDLTATNWQALGTATADGTGGIQFDDTAVTNSGQKFYRLSR